MDDEMKTKMKQQLVLKLTVLVNVIDGAITKVKSNMKAPGLDPKRITQLQSICDKLNTAKFSFQRSLFTLDETAFLSELEAYCEGK